MFKKIKYEKRYYLFLSFVFVLSLISTGNISANKSESILPFSDVAEGKWYYDAVKTMDTGDSFKGRRMTLPKPG